MRILAVFAVAVLLLGGCCKEEKTVQDSPEEIARQNEIIKRINASTTTTIDPLSTSTTREPMYDGIDKLRVGNCVDQASEHVIALAAIDCAKPHHAEVTLIVDLNQRFGERYPTPQDFESILNGECTRAFVAYTGHADTDEAIGVGTYTPLAEGWSLPAERNVTCLAEARKEGNVLTGSAKKA